MLLNFRDCMQKRLTVGPSSSLFYIHKKIEQQIENYLEYFPK
jgi:hypothetical protein